MCGPTHSHHGHHGKRLRRLHCDFVSSTCRTCLILYLRRLHRNIVCFGHGTALSVLMQTFMKLMHHDRKVNACCDVDKATVGRTGGALVQGNRRPLCCAATLSEEVGRRVHFSIQVVHIRPLAAIPTQTSTSHEHPAILQQHRAAVVCSRDLRFCIQTPLFCCRIPDLCTGSQPSVLRITWHITTTDNRANKSAV